MTASTLYEQEHEDFRATVRGWVERHVVPNAERWEESGLVDRELFTAAAQDGVLGFSIDEQYGGGGVDDFRFNAVMNEELGRGAVSSGTGGIALSNDIVFPYFTGLTTDEQKQRWLPGIASGELITAIAMTEPGTGSDLSGIATRAVRDGDDYIVNGAKTFISNGQNADLVATAVRTGDDPHKGISLLVIERGMEGFERGRNLEKIGLHAQDTSELSFTDVRVPAANLLGEEGSGFLGLMRNLPQERLAIALGSLAAAEGTFARTLEYAKERTAFGRPIGTFQSSRHALAEMKTELDVTRAYVDECLRKHVAGELSAEDAAAAKWWCTELQVRLVSRCLQLHGGYGYMREYRVARDYEDCRIATIYGGATEIMKEIVGRGMGL
ncbi:acyl-CoA dehydrogenase family protein [Janibacter alkaliphilus]|uniref:Alkylation response protein AidB-like acyl-CoA dehydrogenase n=1 Tax=Janibacter alkaliphilus TaxID=1069963 RepID=A0A852X318_9MICO|nr:acyl-CoA dehydrogenase family protein [Janibacter alkaliphilus]NYG35670.1 alkylation response protein AidB-like acyl-CoA dehydrogenase [Janibacter alkaliphilus]